MAKRTAHVPLELDTRGTSLTDFAQAICLQEQLEVSLVRLHITVQQLTFPLCLVAASGLRPQVRPRLGDIPAWPLRQIPSVLAQCSVDIPVALPCGPSQTTRTSRKRALSCMDPTLKFGQKSIASCCSGKFRATLLLVFVSTWSGNVRMAVQSRYSTSTRLSTSHYKQRRLRLSAELLIISRRSRPSRKYCHSSLSSTSSRKNQPGSVGSMHHRLRELGSGTNETAPKRRGRRCCPTFSSLIQEAMRRVTAIRQEADTLLHIAQNNPLAGNSHAHQSGARACYAICTVETLEDALGQIP